MSVNFVCQYLSLVIFANVKEDGSPYSTWTIDSRTRPTDIGDDDGRVFENDSVGVGDERAVG
jgi:hypothetical protein